MAFPANLTNAIDGVTDVLAAHLNDLEQKVGIDGSLVTTSLDYLLKNSASIDPGHVHTFLHGGITLDKIENLEANSIIGNSTASPATPQALTVSQVKTLLAIAQADVIGLTASSSPSFAALNVSGATNALSFTATAPNGFLGTAQANTYTGFILSNDVPGHSAYFLCGGSTRTGTTLGVNNADATLFYTNHQPFALGTNDNFPVYIGTNATIKVTVLGSGNVGIGTMVPNTAALLQLSSTTKGFLPPVMTTTQKNAISSPPAGLVVYDSTLNKLCVYTGSVWETITSV